jgi:DNA-directed RNA polymerase subunit N (RpoN/RPB10)
MAKISGVKCEQCGKELCHEVNQFERTVIEYEDQLARQHERDNPGHKVVRFVTDG